MKGPHRLNVGWHFEWLGAENAIGKAMSSKGDMPFTRATCSKVAIIHEENDILRDNEGIVGPRSEALWELEPAQSRRIDGLSWFGGVENSENECSPSVFFIVTVVGFREEHASGFGFSKGDELVHCQSPLLAGRI